MDTTSLKCKKCGSEIPINPGYTSWCDKCGWNVVPYELEKEDKLSTKILFSIGRKSSEVMLKKVIKEYGRKPKFTIQLFIVYVISTVIYIINAILFLLLIALGLYALKISFNYVGAVGALVFFFFAYLARPRFVKVNIKPLERKDFSGLYGIVDEIAAELKLTKIDGIAISGDFNACFIQSGIRGKKYIVIGLPLFYVLEEQEKVALLSHELAHNANNDASRGIFISEALRILESWYNFLNPDYLACGISVGGILAIPVNLIKLLLAKMLYLLWYVISVLLWRNKQISEYYADYLASKISGTDAMVSLLEKSHYDTVFYESIRKSNFINYTDNLFEKLKNKLSVLPEREKKRIKLINESGLYSIDSTHPPTAFRIQYLNKNFCEGNKQIGQTFFKQMRSEIELLCNQLQTSIINQYRQ